VAFVAAAIVAPSWIQAHQYLGTLSGSGSDATGVKVVGAKVTAIDVTTKFATNSVTNGSGDYTIPFLTPDTYTVTIEAQGFGTQTRTGITLTAGGNQHTDFALQAGAASAQITVTADNEQLNATSADLDTTLSTSEVTDMPNVGHASSGLVDSTAAGSRRRVRRFALVTGPLETMEALGNSQSSCRRSVAMVMSSSPAPRPS